MKQQIISLLERAKENGRTIGDVLAEVRGMRPACLTCDDHGAVGNILDTVQCPDCSQHAESKLEWIATPDIRDVPDCVLTPRGVALKQSQISVAEEAQDVKLPEIPSAYNDTGGYVGYAKSDLAAYARAAVMADRASRPARPEPTDAELATLASEFMMSGSCSTRYYFDDRGFARALLARYGAQPASSAEPVACLYRERRHLGSLSEGRDFYSNWSEWTPASLSHGKELQGKSRLGEFEFRWLVDAATPAAAELAPVADERAGTVNSEPLPVVARLYYTGSPHRRYRRASTQAGPGEPLCFVSVAEAWLRRKDARIVALEKELALLQASAPVAGEAKPLPLETALHALVDKIAPGLDTGDLVRDAERASALLSDIMKRAPSADGRDAKDAARKSAGNIQEPMNGDGWHVVWWNESMRLMLPDGSRLDRFQGYRNGTMQLTIKTDAAIAAQQGEGGGV